PGWAGEIAANTPPEITARPEADVSDQQPIFVEEPKPTPPTQPATSRLGNNISTSLPPPGGSKAAAAIDTFAQDHADEPFDDQWLYQQGYHRTRVYNYTLPDGTRLYQPNR